MGDSLVEDTHYIDRATYRPSSPVTRGEYVGAEGDWTPWILERLVFALLLAGALSAGLALLVSAAPTTIWRLLRWGADRVPIASAEAVAIFRIIFGVGVLAIVLTRPLGAGLATWQLCWGILFIAGLMARTSFVMLTAGVLAWAPVFTTQIGAHAISALLVALICLLWSRWGDAWSIDAWLRQRRGAKVHSSPSRLYGYTVWIPGVVLGMAFAAAALAKVRENGLAWMLNGTVKYHFLTDSVNAPVEWGLKLGLHPNLAVFFSIAAVAIEALVIVGAFSRVYRYRAAAGIAALSIFIGFALFQGVFWPAWWILLLAFLPWHRINEGAVLLAPRSAPPLRRSSLEVVQVAVVAVLIVQQVFVSALEIELNPLLSTYDMYATTYDSPQDYEYKAGVTYWLVTRMTGRPTEDCPITQIEAQTLSALTGDVVDPRSVGPIVEECVQQYGRPLESPPSVIQVWVERRSVAVDWTQWRLAGLKTVPLAGPIRLDLSTPR